MADRIPRVELKPEGKQMTVGNMEAAVNQELGNVLRARYPEWGDGISVEKTGMFEEALLKPDIVVYPPDGIPVVIETEFAPASGVENEAGGHLGKKLMNGPKIDRAVALRLPVDLQRVELSRLSELILSSRFKFCFLFKSRKGRPHDRLPDEDWIEGDVDELLSYIETSAWPED